MALPFLFWLPNGEVNENVWGEWARLRIAPTNGRLKIAHRVKNYSWKAVSIKTGPPRDDPALIFFDLYTFDC